MRLNDILSVKYFNFFGVAVGLNYLFLTQVLLAFTGNMILGFLYVRWGLVYAMTVKLILGFKYLALMGFMQAGS